MALLFEAVVAEAEPLPPLADGSIAAWQAIGVVNAEGAGGIAQCTGTLVSFALVLTAAHCVRGAVKARAPLYFVPGGIKGRATPDYRSTRIEIHPAYFAREGIDQFRVDLALLHLEKPIAEEFVRLLDTLVFNPSDGGEFATLAFHRSRPHGLRGQFDCTRDAQTQENELHIACHVVSGNSGAPVMRHQAGVWKIIGVISASLDLGLADHALVATLDDWVMMQVVETQQKEVDR